MSRYTGTAQSEWQAERRCLALLEFWWTAVEDSRLVIDAAALISHQISGRTRRINQIKAVVRSTTY